MQLHDLNKMYRFCPPGVNTLCRHLLAMTTWYFSSSNGPLIFPLLLIIAFTNSTNSGRKMMPNEPDPLPVDTKQDAICEMVQTNKVNNIRFASGRRGIVYSSGILVLIVILSLMVFLIIRFMHK